MIAGFIGKMGCLPKGTLVRTIRGVMPIECVDSVLSYDFDGNIVSVPCGVVETKKVPFVITFADGSQVVASEEHKWFISNIRADSTINLKKGDRILSFNHEPIQESENTDKALASPTSNRILETRTSREDEQAILWKEKSCVSSRKNGRSEEKPCRVLIDSETGTRVGMLVLQEQADEQSFRLSCSSQGLRQHEQLTRKLGCFVPTVSRTNPSFKTVISIERQSNVPVVMYDLIVPNTNNFILDNGLLTHNSGKTLSMTKELLKYYNQGYTIMANYGLSFPHEKIDFEELFLSAQAQEPLDNVVIALDEIHIVLDSRSGMAATNKIISFWLNQTRKMKVKLFYTTQHAHQIDKRLRSATDFYVMCDGFKINKEGKEYFVCYNEITDGDFYKKDLFVGNEYFKYYDTSEVIKFIDRAALKKRAKEARG